MYFFYYKNQCDYCANKGCDYERKTRKFVETISGVESLASGVYGRLDFKCDYFKPDVDAYNKDNPAETCGG